MRTFFSTLLILIGLVSLGGSVFMYWQRLSPKRLEFDINDKNYFTKVYSGERYPTVLRIADLSIELPVFPASVNGGRWQATTRGVSYLTGSPIPGDLGNSILYGHDWPSLLGNLKNAKVGNRVEVVFSDGSIKNFVIRFIQEVSPSETAILDQSSDKRITLYTCSGFLDSKRFVVSAIYQGEILSSNIN